MRRPAPLHASLRYSIVQRPRRKAHAATLAPGADRWVAFCGREVLAAGADFVPEAEVVSAVDERVEALCSDCYHLLAFAALVAERVLANVAAVRRIS